MTASVDSVLADDSVFSKLCLCAFDDGVTSLLTLLLETLILLQKFPSFRVIRIIFSFRNRI